MKKKDVKVWVRLSLAEDARDLGSGLSPSLPPSFLLGRDWVGLSSFLSSLWKMKAAFCFCRPCLLLLDRSAFRLYSPVSKAM